MFSRPFDDSVSKVVGARLGLAQRVGDLLLGEP